MADIEHLSQRQTLKDYTKTVTPRKYNSFIYAYGDKLLHGSYKERKTANVITNTTYQ